MEFSIYCCLKLKDFILEMQQVQIVICPPSFAMIGSCVLSIPCLLCVTRWSKCGRSASKFLEVSMVLQERILYMRNGATFPVSCFSTQYAAAKHEARRRRDDDFGQEMVLWLEAFVWHQDCSLIYHISAVATGLLMISINWYAKLNLLLFAISEILGLIFEPVVFASQCLECQNWNKFSSVNLWIQVNMTVGDLLNNYVHTQYINFRGSKCLGFGILLLQVDLNADASINLESMATAITIHELHFWRCFCCTCLSLSDHCHVEDVVSMLFGLCHRRWTATPPSMILRFNSGDTLSMSSVKVIRYLQLISTPRVHIPDRLLGEPPAGHQLDRTSVEALEDCRCGTFESELSTDERTPFGSICNLPHLFHEFRSPYYGFVHLGTYLSSSTVESPVMLYHEP